MTTKTQTEKEDKYVEVLFFKRDGEREKTDVIHIPKHIFDYFVKEKEYQVKNKPKYWLWTSENMNPIGFGVSPCEFEKIYGILRKLDVIKGFILRARL